MAEGRQPKFSLRVASLVSTLVLGGLVVLLAIALTVTSRMLWGSIGVAERNTQSVVLCIELGETVREYQRVANLYLATRDPALVEIRTGLERNLERILLRLGETTEGQEESTLFSRLQGDVNTWLVRRRVLDERSPSVEATLRSTRPQFEAVLASIEALRRQNEGELEAARRRGEQVLRFEVVLAIGSIVLLVIGLALATFGVRWLVARPLFEVQKAMLRFRHGDPQARAPVAAADELNELSVTFNEMADTIADQRRDQLTFLAGVAHDLRTPLSTLRLTVHALARNPSATTPERLLLLDRQIDRLNRMVGDLLDATRIEAGELELKLEEVDLRGAAETVVDLYAPTTSTHRVNLHVPDAPVIVRGDSGRLEQVISNLVSNAIKYSPGGGDVDVEVHTDGALACVSVADQGVGIPEEELPTMFMPFRRWKPTAELVPGVGLGLSIVRRIVDAHGGRIEVESTPGIGSTFRIWLPLSAHRGVDPHGRRGEPIEAAQPVAG